MSSLKVSKTNTEEAFETKDSKADLFLEAITKKSKEGKLFNIKGIPKEPRASLHLKVDPFSKVRKQLKDVSVIEDTETKSTMVLVSTLAKLDCYETIEEKIFRTEGS
jgi:hypothetical protein